VKVLFLILLVFSLSFLFFSISFATSSSIILTPDNSTYTHGEFLNFYITVDEVGHDAVMYIGDDFGKKDKLPESIRINELETHFIFPYSFSPEIFPEGKYFVFIEYEDKEDSIEFNIINSNKITIPIPDRMVIVSVLIPWVEQNQEDIFGKIIKYFKNKKFIDISNDMDDETLEKLNAPEWVKTNASWWIDGKISDNDFAVALQYLIQEQIIKI